MQDFEIWLHTFQTHAFYPGSVPSFGTIGMAPKRRDPDPIVMKYRMTRREEWNPRRLRRDEETEDGESRDPRKRGDPKLIYVLYSTHLYYTCYRESTYLILS